MAAGTARSTRLQFTLPLTPAVGNKKGPLINMYNFSVLFFWATPNGTS
jgi:hypothetical protein